MAEDLNEGSPIRFAAESVEDVYCALDPSLMGAAFGWARRFPVPRTGNLEWALQLKVDRTIRLEVKPEMVLTDIYRSRYYAMLYLLGELNSRLAAA